MCSWGLFAHMWLQMIIWGKGFWQATLFMLSALCIKSARYLSSDLLCGTLQRFMSCFQQILNSSCVKWAGWLGHVIHDISYRPKRDSQMLYKRRMPPFPSHLLTSFPSCELSKRFLLLVGPSWMITTVLWLLNHWTYYFEPIWLSSLVLSTMLNFFLCHIGSWHTWIWNQIRSK